MKEYNLVEDSLIDVTMFFDWFNFGLCLKAYKLNEHSTHIFAIELQLAWFDFWLECIKK